MTSAGRQSLTPTATLTYGADSATQVLDLHLPDGAGPWPLVISIHGGAFMMGDRTWEIAHAPALLEHGYAVAAVEYRLSGEALFPAAVRDVKQAAAFLRLHATDLGLDPTFFVAWGRSAGGHLSAMLGVTTGRETEFDRGLGDSSVQAVVDWYGPTDFLQMDAQLAAVPPTGDVPPVQNHDAADSPESRWLGGPIQELPELAERANPIAYVDTAAGLPPFFLAAGTDDHLVPHQQTLLLADALRAHGTTVVLHLLDGARHGDQRFESELVAPALDWLETLRQAQR